jgi:hypothetical protein
VCAFPPFHLSFEVDQVAEKFFSGYTMQGTKFSFILNVNCQGMKLTAHLHLFPRLRTGGAAPLLTLYSFMACKGELNLYFDTVVRNTQNGEIWMVSVIQ